MRLRCAPNDGFLEGNARWLRQVVAESTARYAVARDSLRLPVMDSLLVQPVLVDSLCARAGVTINRDRGLPDSTGRAVYLIQLDTIYWAADTTITAGEFVVGYFLNARLDSVRLKVLI
jgi:hypothetical protein